MLIAFLVKHAREKGITQQQIADKIGWHQSNIARLESGKYLPTLENFLKYAEAIGVRIELHAEGSKSSNIARNSETPKFIFAPDAQTNELFILHTKFPACLIKVVQTIPMKFIIVDLYDDVEDVLEMEFLEDAKMFFKKFAANLDLN